MEITVVSEMLTSPATDPGQHDGSLSSPAYNNNYYYVDTDSNNNWI